MPRLPHVPVVHLLILVATEVESQFVDHLGPWPIQSFQVSEEMFSWIQPPTGPLKGGCSMRSGPTGASADEGSAGRERLGFLLGRFVELRCRSADRHQALRDGVPHHQVAAGGRDLQPPPASPPRSSNPP